MYTSQNQWEVVIYQLLTSLWLGHWNEWFLALPFDSCHYPTVTDRQSADPWQLKIFRNVIFQKVIFKSVQYESVIFKMWPSQSVIVQNVLWKPSEMKSPRAKASEIRNEFLKLNKNLLASGVDLTVLEKFNLKNKNDKDFLIISIYSAFLLLFCFLYQNGTFTSLYKQALGVRCVIPNNYFIWESTRPLSSCDFCLNITEPIILYNVTRNEFAPYAYTSKPVVIRNASNHWPAFKLFDFHFFKRLYENVEGSYRSVDDECQFLHFQSNFISIRDVFSMSEARVFNEPGEESWYVGWWENLFLYSSNRHSYSSIIGKPKVIKLFS